MFLSLGTHLIPNTYKCTIAFVKRRELEKALKDLGWRLLRHGGNHDVWTDGEKQEAIPRHIEISERLARAVLARSRKKKR